VEDDEAPGRWPMLVLLALAELLGMSLWFAASAVSTQYQQAWSLTASEAAWLTTAVQLGFVGGTAVSAVLNLADIVAARRLFAGSALLAAGCNAMVLSAHGLETALLWRALTGGCLAGVYPPAMKMIATWFRARRGMAVGTIVGALTVGKALPYLVKAVPGATIANVTLAASVGAVVAAVIVWRGYRDGPYAFPPRRFSWQLVGDVAREPRWRLAMGGYLGHMWELYAAWTWLPVFVAASVAAQGVDARTAGVRASVLAFCALAVGGAGCIWGGVVADRRGRAWLVNTAMFVSGLCSLGIGAAFGRSLWLLAPIALVWGFFVIADSAQFSVMITESVPAHAVGTALTLQTSLGFLLTAGVIQLVPLLEARVGWPWAFTMLALGPMVGIASIKALTDKRFD
jgi:MFS family permease